MPKLSEKYRAIADLYAYLELRSTDCANCDCVVCGANCHFEVVDDGDGIEIADSLYRQLSASSVSNQLLAAVEACGIEIRQYDQTACADTEFFELLPEQ